MRCFATLALCALCTLPLLGCPEEKGTDEAAKPKLNKVQADIAHAPKSYLDKAEAAGERAEKAAEVRQEAAADIEE